MSTKASRERRCYWPTCDTQVSFRPFYIDEVVKVDTCRSRSMRVGSRPFSAEKLKLSKECKIQLSKE